MSKRPLGVDIGGTGIKGAPVDLDKGEFAAGAVPHRHPASTPDAVATVAEVIAHFDPGTKAPDRRDLPRRRPERRRPHRREPRPVVIGGDLGRCDPGRPPEVLVMNDADAAGYAEYHYGAAKGKDGLVVMTTLGTGIGRPSSRRARAEHGARAPHDRRQGRGVPGRRERPRPARASTGPSGPSACSGTSPWSNLFWPDLIVVGGGVSKHHKDFLPLLDIRTTIVPAKLRNAAGIVGAALLATQTQESRGKHKA